jgi:hypothetical protein
MILQLSHHRDTSSPPMQSVPDCEQHTFSISSPLMIPESQLFNIPRRQKLFSLFIVLALSRHTVLKAVRFNGQLCCGTIEIEDVFPNSVLAAELEADKSPGS